MTDERAARRQELGVSAKLWSAQGSHQVGDGWWEARSGAPSADYNVLVCHGGQGPAAVAARLGEIEARGTPAILMLAGAALGDAQAAADAGWACIGSTPLLVHGDPHGSADPDVRPLEAGELAAARAVVAGAFDLDESLAQVAVPDDPAAILPGAKVWGLWEGGDLQACVLVVVVDGSLAIWSLAASPDRVGRGYGRRLLGSVLGAAGDEGVARSVLYSSNEGLPLYLDLGFEVLEHWQLWSRPRWVLGRT